MNKTLQLPKIARTASRQGVKEISERQLPRCATVKKKEPNPWLYVPEKRAIYNVVTLDITGQPKRVPTSARLRRSNDKKVPVCNGAKADFLKMNLYVNVNGDRRRSDVSEKLKQFKNLRKFSYISLPDVMGLVSEEVYEEMLNIYGNNQCVILNWKSDQVYDLGTIIQEASLLEAWWSDIYTLKNYVGKARHIVMNGHTIDCDNCLIEYVQIVR